MVSSWRSRYSPLLLGDPNPNSYSSDGRYLLYSVFNATNRDVGVLPLGGDRKPFLFAHSTFNETQAQFSPDGKWVAYVSDESGAPEIYMQAFPAGGEKRECRPRAAPSHDGGEMVERSITFPLVAT